MINLKILKDASRLFSNKLFKISILVVLVASVLFFANPFSMLSDFCSMLFQSNVSSSGSCAVTDVELKGELKPIIRFVGGFLELPADTPENIEIRKNVTIVYQWEGSAEFLLDLEKIRIEQITNNIALLHMPKIKIGNYRVNSFDREGEERLVLQKGGAEADRIMFSIDKIVYKTMEKMLDTEKNMNAARKQTEKLLRSMISVASNMNVEFDWGERAVEKK